MDKKFRLPKDEFIDDQDVEGHKIRDAAGATGPDDLTVLPAPPSIGLRRTPGHGGEAVPDEEDVEGHRLI